MVKNLPAMQEMWVQSLGQEDPLEKGMATHSTILAWRIPWPEEPGGLRSMGLQRVRHDWATHTLTFVGSFYNGRWFFHHFLFLTSSWFMCTQSLSFVWLFDPMHCRLSGSSIHEILQARILEWVAIPFSRGSSWPRDRTQVSCIVGGFFTSVLPGKPS